VGSFSNIESGLPSAHVRNFLSALLFCAVTALAEIPALFSQRPIVLRHQRGALYHPFTDALALTIVDVPVMFVNVTIFGILFYFLSGLQTSAVSIFVFTYDFTY
jgi:ATP-binding cassette subfamily G (WHITE) protein 2 (SNQ2)